LLPKFSKNITNFEKHVLGVELLPLNLNVNI
jgi:hypothetical protein